MVASVNNHYGSIPNVDNRNDVDINNRSNVDAESSSLLSGATTTPERDWKNLMMMRSTSSSRRAAGFLVLLFVGVLVASYITDWQGNQPNQDYYYEDEEKLASSSLLWGRPKSDTVDDDSDDDSGHTHTRTRTFSTDDDSDASSGMSSSSSSSSSGSDSDWDSDFDSKMSLKKHHKGGDKIRKCTFLECWKAKCSWSIDPYVCLLNNGGPQMGCSSSPWEEGTCEEQCDLSSCEGMTAPDTLDDKTSYSCKHEPCPKEWCCGSQGTCDFKTPYQCLSGSSRFGCHDDPLQWNIKVDDATCSQCCDTTTCSAHDMKKCETIVTTAASKSLVTNKTVATTATNGDTHTPTMESSAVAGSPSFVLLVITAWATMLIVNACANDLVGR